MSTEHNASAHRPDKAAKPTARNRWSTVVSRWRNRLISRRRGLGLTAVMVSTAIVAQGSIVSNAHWNDSEWGNATVGTTDCNDPEGDFTSRGEGRVLSGSLLGIDLDNLAEAKGVEVTNDGFGSVRDPESAVDLEKHAYSNPLNIEALNLADVNLTGLLELPLDTETGALNQYGQATNTAESVGAAGTVSDDGGISLEQYEGDVPDIATLNLSNLLNSTELGLGDLLQDVTDLELKIGAVAGRAWLDGCGDSWGVDDSVTRDYLTSHVDLELASPTVGALGTTISGTVGTLESTVDTLVGQENPVGGVLDTVVSLLGTISGIGSLILPVRLESADATATLEVDLDLQPVRDVIDQPISDPAGIVNLTLSEGLVHIDTVALLAAAYSDPNVDAEETYTHGLNELAPNTEPLSDPRVLTELTSQLTDVLGGVIGEVDTMLDDILDETHIKAEIRIPVSHCSAWLVVCLGWSDAGDLIVQVAGSLDDVVRDVDGVVTIDTSALLGGVLGGLANILVESVLELLTPVLGGLVGNVVLDSLEDLAALPTNLVETTVNPVIELVSTLYKMLFLDGVVALTINAQNDPATGLEEPQDWEALEDGRYDVAAIRVGVLDALGDDAVRLYLGRGSVGPSRSVAQTAQP